MPQNVRHSKKKSKIEKNKNKITKDGRRNVKNRKSNEKQDNQTENMPSDENTNTNSSNGNRETVEMNKEASQDSNNLLNQKNIQNRIPDIDRSKIKTFDKIPVELNLLIDKYLTIPEIRKVSFLTKNLYDNHRLSLWKNVFVVGGLTNIYTDMKIVSMQLLLSPNSTTWIPKNLIKTLYISVNDLWVLSQLDFFVAIYPDKLQEFYPNLEHCEIFSLRPDSLAWSFQGRQFIHDFSKVFKTISFNMEFLTQPPMELDQVYSTDFISVAPSLRYVDFDFSTSTNNCISIILSTSYYSRIINLDRLVNLRLIKFFPNFNTPPEVYVQFYTSLTNLVHLKHLETKHSKLNTLHTLENIPHHITNCYLHVQLFIMPYLRPTVMVDPRLALIIPQVTGLSLKCDEFFHTMYTYLTHNSHKQFWSRVQFPNLKTFENIHPGACSYRSFSFALVPVITLQNLTHLTLHILTSRDCHSFLYNVEEMTNLEQLNFHWTTVNQFEEVAKREISTEIVNGFMKIMSMITDALTIYYSKRLQKKPKSWGESLFPINSDDIRFYNALLDRFAADALNHELWSNKAIDFLGYNQIRTLTTSPAIVFYHLRLEEEIIEAVYDPLDNPQITWDFDYEGSEGAEADLNERFYPYQPNLSYLMNDNSINLVDFSQRLDKPINKYIRPNVQSSIMYRTLLAQQKPLEGDRKIMLFLNLLWPYFFYYELFNRFLELPNLTYVTITGWSQSFSMPGLYHLVKEHKTLKAMEFYLDNKIYHPGPAYDFQLGGKLSKTRTYIGNSFPEPQYTGEINMEGAHYYGEMMTSKMIHMIEFDPPTYHHYLQKVYKIDVESGRNKFARIF